MVLLWCKVDTLYSNLPQSIAFSLACNKSVSFVTIWLLDVFLWLVGNNLQVEQTNALCNDIEGHKIISKCLFCNIFVGVFAFAHNIGRQFGGIATYLCTETLVETIESGPLCITDLFQN